MPAPHRTHPKRAAFARRTPPCEQSFLPRGSNICFSFQNLDFVPSLPCNLARLDVWGSICPLDMIFHVCLSFCGGYKTASGVTRDGKRRMVISESLCWRSSCGSPASGLKPGGSGVRAFAPAESDMGAAGADHVPTPLGSLKPVLLA